MTSFTVRLERSEDRASSLEVERAAFGHEEEAEIVRTVAELPGSFALVAERAGAVVGHVQFSQARVGTLAVAALGPIGVRPDRQGEGIGGALVRAGLEEARRRGAPAVILLGSPDYYGRFGFVPSSRYALRNPYTGVEEEGFVVREEDFQLVVLAEPAPELAGDVRWHPAFGEPG